MTAMVIGRPDARRHLRNIRLKTGIIVITVTLLGWSCVLDGYRQYREGGTSTWIDIHVRPEEKALQKGLSQFVGRNEEVHIQPHVRLCFEA